MKERANKGIRCLYTEYQDGWMDGKEDALQNGRTCSHLFISHSPVPTVWNELTAHNAYYSQLLHNISMYVVPKDISVLNTTFLFQKNFYYTLCPSLALFSIQSSSIFIYSMYGHHPPFHFIALLSLLLSPFRAFKEEGTDYSKYWKVWSSAHGLDSLLVGNSLLIRLWNGRTWI